MSIHTPAMQEAAKALQQAVEAVQSAQRDIERAREEIANKTAHLPKLIKDRDAAMKVIHELCGADPDTGEFEPSAELIAFNRND